MLNKFETTNYKLEITWQSAKEPLGLYKTMTKSNSLWSPINWDAPPPVVLNFG